MYDCKEFIDMIKELNILCKKCLDTSLMWKVRDDINNITLDNHEYFIIIRCDQCDNHQNNEIIAYSQKSELYYNNIPIFHADNENYSIRLPILRKLCQNRIIQIELFDMYL